MAWHAGTTAADYRDALVKIVEFATSQHVSAVVINSGGTGYSVSDLLTVTHAGAVLDCTIEVTSVNSGVIDGIALRNMGAFSNRIATVAINAAGASYVVGDILQVDGGTFTQRGKVQVDAESAGAITGISVFEGGGAYSIAPSLTAEATFGVGPAAFGGNDAATVDITMTGLIGTTGIAATGGGGSSATFDLTLTPTGQTTVRDNHDFTVDSITDEKEVILRGSVVGADAPYIGLRSYTDSVGGGTDRWGIMITGMTAFDVAAAHASQPDVGPATTPGTTGSYILLLDAAMAFSLSCTGRRMEGVFTTVGVSETSDMSWYAGFLNQFGNTTENPYPLYVAASCAIFNTDVDIGGLGITSITEAMSPSGGTGPSWFYRVSDSTWVIVENSRNGVVQRDHVVYPVGEPEQVTGGTDENNITLDGNHTFSDGIALNTGGTATRLMIPTPDTGGDLFLPVPATVIRSPDITNGAGNDIHGELDNIFWISGTATGGGSIATGDDFTIAGQRYRVFQSAHRTERYSFFAMAER